MGEWKHVGRARDYLQSQHVHCQLCGKILPRLGWVADENGRELAFCNSDCERLYRDYWLPRYGTGKS